MFFLFKQKTAYEMRISDWSSDVCSSDLPELDFVMYEAEEHEVPVPAVFQACGNEGIFSIAYPLLADDGTSRLKQGVEGSVFAPDRDFPTVQALEPTLLRSGLRSEEHTSELQSLMRISYAVFCMKTKQQ